MTYKEFLEEIGGPGAVNVKYRPMAPFTAPFGVDISTGEPRIHTGVDRGAGILNGKPIPIYAPFDFLKGTYRDFAGKGYGSMIYLYHPTGFILAIAHCYEKDILIRDKLNDKTRINRGELIGYPGSYGNSTGIHTHTEIRAWGPIEQLDRLLMDRYGSVVDKWLTEDDIKSILKNNNIEVKDLKGAGWMRDTAKVNEYKILRVNGLVYYNSRKLFGL